MYKLLFVFIPCVFSSLLATAESMQAKYTFEAGHPSLQVWLLPEAPVPADNIQTKEKIELGKQLFFDPRLSGDQNMSCATCHNPLFGWSDGLPKAIGSKGKVLPRATPSVINTAFNRIQMWDGRKSTLEDQALGPMMSAEEMNMHLPNLLSFLNQNPDYSKAFKKAFPDQPIDETTLRKALSSFQRTILSNNSPFDKWVKGDKKAMTQGQIHGFEIFVDPNKGNCEVCHSAPNFTDDSFNNLGLASYGEPNPDLGRFNEKPINIMKGAFKTPTLRDISLTAPYFHDGSAITLSAVIEHYATGGVVKTNVSRNMKELHLSKTEKEDLLDFLSALTTPEKNFELPILPK